LYLGLVLYGSLTPFDLRADARMVEAHFRRAWVFWPIGPVHANREDIPENIALYAPFGLLLAMRLRLAGVRRCLALLAAAEAALAISMAVEATQLLSLCRVASATDVLMNTIGGLLGGLPGATLAPYVYLQSLYRVRARLRRCRLK
jgi:VanZ family protein